MSEPPPAADGLARRLLVIGGATVLMLVAVVALAPAVRPDRPPRLPPVVPPVPADEPIPEEAGVFEAARARRAVDPVGREPAGGEGRTLAGFRELRAYPGAPPRIPHALSDEEFLETACLQCHARGGWAARFGAFTPPTPHPEMASCLQCHVPQNTGAHFRPTAWVPADWPALDTRAMEGSPPLIPHDLSMRGACLACHAGPSAVEAVRTTHPERLNCRQCHLPLAPDGRPGREAGAGGVFVRPGGGAP